MSVGVAPEEYTNGVLRMKKILQFPLGSFVPSESGTSVDFLFFIFYFFGEAAFLLFAAARTPYNANNRIRELLILLKASCI